MLNNNELESKKEIAIRRGGRGSMMINNLRLRFVIFARFMRRENRVIFFIGG